MNLEDAGNGSDLDGPPSDDEGADALAQPAGQARGASAAAQPAASKKGAEGRGGGGEGRDGGGELSGAEEDEDLPAYTEVVDGARPA